VTVLQSDTTPPMVQITTPQAKSLYLGNHRVLPFPITLLVGSIDVTADASDNDSGVASVLFYLDGNLMNTVTTPPYSWRWSDRGFGRYTILVKAVDGAGNNMTGEMVVWKVF